MLATAASAGRKQGPGSPVRATPRLAGAAPVPRNVRRAPAVADDADTDSPALSAAWWWASKSSDSSASAALEPSLPQDDVARLLCCAISPRQ